jgi:hypothetical protein
MRRGRVVLLVGTLLAVGSVLVLGPGRVAGLAVPSGLGATAEVAGARDGGSLRMYYTAPVLARAGEPVRVPVDVVCATGSGRPCGAAVTVGAREAGGAWRSAGAAASATLQFDVTAAAARAVARSRTGSVEFFIRADDDLGRSISFPQGEKAAPLRFYVTGDMPVAEIPPVPFGRVRPPETVLFLPWGTGPMRAGLVLGNESLTLGPSAFAVEGGERIHLLDSQQERLATFAAGRLLDESTLELGWRATLAVADDGSRYVLDDAGDTVTLRRISPGGAVGSPVKIGEGIPAEVRTVGEEVYVNLLPLDAWISAVGPPNESSVPLTGVPVNPRVQLLRVAREGSIRLGTVDGEGVRDAVELRSEVAMGAVLLAEPDGRNGYWLVVHVWRERPTPADQYQVLHVSGGRIASTFAVGDDRFAETPPRSRFRMGPDGHLYQLRTCPDGMRIVRFDLEEGPR